MPFLFSFYQANASMEDNINSFAKENSTVLSLVGACSIAYASGCVSTWAYTKFKNWKNTNLLDDLTREPYEDRNDRVHHLKMISDILADLNFDISMLNNASDKNMFCRNFMKKLVEASNKNKLKSNFSIFLDKRLFLKRWLWFTPTPENMRVAGNSQTFIKKLKEELAVEVKCLENILKSKATRSLAKLEEAYYRSDANVTALLQSKNLSPNNINNRIYAICHILKCTYEAVVDIFNHIDTSNPIDVRLQ